MSARGLAKKYGDFTAVDSIDFDVQKGEAFGFLGPNGAGKSTTMRMVGCVSPPSGGSLSIFGLDAATTLFVDDSPANVAAAADLGFVTHRFVDAAALEALVEQVVPALGS